jgi:hypothetical protein
MNLSDTWEWDGTTWTLRSMTGPAARFGHAMVYDSLRGQVVLFGGFDMMSLGDTWEWNGIAWTFRSTTGPPPRFQHALAFDSSRGRTVLFGGRASIPSYLGDTWEWNGATWAQSNIGKPSPSARGTHALAYNPTYGRVVLFGGYGGSFPYFGDTWEWDGMSWTRRSTSGAGVRAVHAMAYDSARDRVMLFGGFNGSQYLGDTWEYHGIRPGDINVDGHVDGLDIEPLISALLANSTNPDQLYLADFDISGAVDPADVPPFVSALLSSSP